MYVYICRLGQWSTYTLKYGEYFLSVRFVYLSWPSFVSVSFESFVVNYFPLPVVQFTYSLRLYEQSNVFVLRHYNVFMHVVAVVVVVVCAFISCHVLVAISSL